MTKQEYENKIKKLQDELEQLKKVKIKDEQSKRWKPKDYKPYYYVNWCGDYTSVLWDNGKVDKWLYLIGNCFKTEEEAKEYKKQIEYTARYKNYIEEHSEQIDWNDRSKEKYFSAFNYSQDEIVVFSGYMRMYQGTIYASSEEIIWDAIKEVGEDNFKKYVLGVK